MAKENEVLSIGDREVTITNPRKVYFPETGHTKLDLVRYYLAVADGALRGAGGRPMALKRFVDGAAGQPFFQKRAPENTPEWVRTATLTFPSGRTADEIVVDDAAGLAWVVNLGCIDLNPHPVRADDLDHPDELRVDLDPVPGRAVGPDPRRRARDARGARGGRARRLAEDVRLARDPHQRPDRAALDVPGGPPGGPRARPRRRAARARTSRPRSGGRRSATASSSTTTRTPRTGRSPRPTRSGRCPTRASRRRCPGTRSRPSRPRRSRSTPCRRGSPSIGDPGAGIDDAVGSLEALLELSRRDEAEGLGDAPWPPNYAKQAGEPPRVQPSRARRPTSEYDPGRGEGGGPPPDVAAERAAAVAAGDPNAGLPTEWAGSRPTPTGRRKTSIPVVEISRAEFKDEALAGLERWKARHPDIAEYLEPADVLVDGMRGRSAVWYRVRVNLIHVPEAERPGQEPLESDYDPWAGQDIEAWKAATSGPRARRAGTEAETKPAEPDPSA